VSLRTFWLRQRKIWELTSNCSILLQLARREPRRKTACCSKGCHGGGHERVELN
jgi:hypothetical protein